MNHLGRLRAVVFIIWFISFKVLEVISYVIFINTNGVTAWMAFT